MQELLIPFKRNGLWGYIDLECNIIIPPTYSDAKPFCNGLGIVLLNEQFNDFSNFSERIQLNYDRLKEKNKLTRFECIIDIEGKYIIEPYFRECSIIKNGFLKASQFGQSDFRGNEFNLVPIYGNYDEKYPLNSEYSQIQSLSNGFWILENGESPVGKDNIYYSIKVVDEKLNLIIDITKRYGYGMNLSNFEYGIMKVGKNCINNETDFISISGEIIFSAPYNMNDISKNINGIYFYKKGGKLGIIDLNKGLVHDAIYEDIGYKDIFETCFFEGSL
ncbi:MAG TPA: WG repeat-containing protein [Bacteroidia bacterium]